MESVAVQGIPISIHALLAESDRGGRCRASYTSLFLSTLSLRRATVSAPDRFDIAPISIHALLAESDVLGAAVGSGRGNFYPRSPCGERPDRAACCCGLPRFLSTLSLRRATGVLLAAVAAIPDFYPRSPCGERRPMMVLRQHRRRYFYPRSPCGERPRPLCAGPVRRAIFLSTLSLRRATVAHGDTGVERVFLSTLSLRRATAKVHKTVGHFCAYGTNFMGISSSC